MSHLSRRGLLASAGAALAAGGGSGQPAPAEAQTGGADPPFGLGTVTYNVPQSWDLATLLKTLPQAGLHAVEFRTTHAHGVEPSLTTAQRAEVRARIGDSAMRQVSLGTVCEFQSPDPAVVQKQVESCREWVKLARDIGALGVKVRPNGLPKDVPLENTLEQIGRALRECGAAAQDQGVEIWVEVHGGGTQEPENFRKILDHCGHKSVGANWNSNPTDLRDGSLRPAFELLKPFLMSVHINTLWGTYPYRELFTLLRQANYRRYTLCEVASAVKPEDGLVFFQCYKGLWRELCRPA